MGRGLDRFILTFVLMVLCLLPSMATAADSEVRVGFFSEEPLAFVGPGGMAQGLAVDVLYSIIEEMGRKPVFIHDDRQVILDRLLLGEIDLIAALPFEYSLTTNITFSENSIAADWGTVYVRSSQVEKLQDLKGMRIGVVDGDRYAPAFKALCGNLGIPMTLFEFQNYEALFQPSGRGMSKQAWQTACMAFDLPKAWGSSLHPSCSNLSAFGLPVPKKGMSPFCARWMPDSVNSRRI